MVNPAASEQAKNDCIAVAGMGLNSKILTHTRCHMNDVKIACDTGVDGVNVYMATSALLSKHSHGKGIDSVIEIASEVIEYVKSRGLEIRFSCEDSFRSDPSDLLRIYEAVDKLGVNRVGIADTVGVATPLQVYNVIRMVREVISPETGIEFHTHDDTGCCIANALMAIEAGATHIDTCVLGIGERNGITPLGGFLGRMYTLDKEGIKDKYDLKLIKFIEKYIASKVSVQIPFNNYITGEAAFSHKAGVHSKAVVSDPSSYEVIDPADFDIERRIQFAHRLTGWNAMQHRAQFLGLKVSDDQIRAATSMIKNLADEQDIALEHVDAILNKLDVHGSDTSSSQLMTMATTISDASLSDELKAAASALKKFETATAQSAVDSLEFAVAAERATATFKVEGHLFDEKVINRIMDIVVDGPCTFEVQNLAVGKRNELHSQAYIVIWGGGPADIDTCLADVKSLVESARPESELTFSVTTTVPL